MKLNTDRQFKNTSDKLAELERLIAERKIDSPRAPGRRSTLQSLTRLANQLREELVRYQHGAENKASVGRTQS